MIQILLIICLIVKINLQSYTTQEYQIQCPSTSGSPTFTVGATHVSSITLSPPVGSQCFSIHYLNQLLAPSTSAQIYPYIPINVLKNSAQFATVIADANGMSVNGTVVTIGSQSSFYFGTGDTLAIQMGTGLTSCSSLNIALLGSATLGAVTLTYQSVCEDPVGHVAIIGQLQGITNPISISTIANPVTVSGSVSVTGNITGITSSIQVSSIGTPVTISSIVNPVAVTGTVAATISGNITGITDSIQISSIGTPVTVASIVSPITISGTVPVSVSGTVPISGTLTGITNTVSVSTTKSCVANLSTSHIYVVNNQAQFQSGLCVNIALSNNQIAFIEPIYSTLFSPYAITIRGLQYFVTNNGITQPTQSFLTVYLSTTDTVLNLCILANTQSSLTNNLLLALITVIYLSCFKIN